MTRDLLPGELSWVDSFVEDLLGDVQKYQIDLLSIPEAQIKSTVEKLDTTSSEFLAGLNVLTYRAENRTSDALVVIDEDTDEEVRKATTKASTIFYEVDEELWNRIFNLESALAKAQREAAAEVDNLADTIKTDREDLWSSTLGWLGDRFSDLEDAFAPLAELTSDGLAYLFSIPAETFMHYLADILAPKGR